MRFITLIIILHISYFASGQNVNVKDYKIYPGLKDVTNQLNELFKEKADTIYFEEGIYNVSELYLSNPVVLIGKKGTILKRLSNQSKFSRILTISGKHSDKRVKIQNITFDGNLLNQGDYSNYKLEQQHLIFISGKKNNQGQTKVSIHNCTFNNSAGDGVTVFVNVDVIITNSTAKDIYRGAIVSNGGNSLLKINNFEVLEGDIIKDSGIDFEVYEVGNHGTKKINAELANVIVQGKFQIGVADKSKVRINNLKTMFSDFYINAPDSEVKITNSHFTINPDKKNRIYGAKKLEVKDCTFIVDDSNSKSRDMLLIMWMNKKIQFKNNQISFINCNFAKTKKDIQGSVFVFETDNLANNNKLILDKIHYDNFNYLVETKRGGRIIIKNTDLKKVNPLLLKYQKTNNRGIDIQIMNSNINQELGEFENKYNSIKKI